jgi:hypothetical protein
MIRNRLNARQQPPGFRLEFRDLIVRPGKSLHRIERIKEADYDDILVSIDKEPARTALGRASEGWIMHCDLPRAQDVNYRVQGESLIKPT